MCLFYYVTSYSEGRARVPTSPFILACARQSQVLCTSRFCMQEMVVNTLVCEQERTLPVSCARKGVQKKYGEVKWFARGCIAQFQGRLCTEEVPVVSSRWAGCFSELPVVEFCVSGKSVIVCFLQVLVFNMSLCMYGKT